MLHSKQYTTKESRVQARRCAACVTACCRWLPIVLCVLTRVHLPNKSHAAAAVFAAVLPAYLLPDGTIRPIRSSSTSIIRRSECFTRFRSVPTTGHASMRSNFALQSSSSAASSPRCVVCKVAVATKTRLAEAPVRKLRRSGALMRSRAHPAAVV